MFTQLLQFSSSMEQHSKCSTSVIVRVHNSPEVWGAPHFAWHPASPSWPATLAPAIKVGENGGENWKPENPVPTRSTYPHRVLGCNSSSDTQLLT